MVEFTGCGGRGVDMAYSLIGRDYTPPDVRAKVTGAAKYAEDFRVEGMVYARLLTSPAPHARIVNLDISGALELPGVVGVMTADDVPPAPFPQTPLLTGEPLFVGDPVLAVAAVDERTAEDAIDRISFDIERLPFVTDPLDSLRPGGPNARGGGNVGNFAMRDEMLDLHWTEEQFRALDQGQLPQGEPAREWTFGEVDAKFAEADYLLDQSFVNASHSHHSMEPRSALSYWENGKCFVYGSSQSGTFPLPMLAGLVGIGEEDLVFIAEYCGGGFGSKGSAYPAMAIPAHFSRLINRPVMLRISREEEYFLGMARHGFQGRVRMGFRSDGRMLAADLYLIQDNGAYGGFTDWLSAADSFSVIYQPEAMRFRGAPVLTNTPGKSAQRGPGQNQIHAAVEPMLDRAARELGLDPLAIRRINAPDSDSSFGPTRRGMTSAHISEALALGAERFDWAGRRARSGQRNGSKVIGVGVGQAYHSAGSSGFDGLVRITPDGKLHVHTGVGNLGTYSYSATSRVAAEVLKHSWENTVIERGDTRRNLPWNNGQFGSNTSFTMTRTNYVAAVDALEKLLEIAAIELGGATEDYDIGGERVFLREDPSRFISYADAAARAIALGGRYSGRLAPEDINPITSRSVAALAGTGLIGVARDNLEREGTPPGLAVGFIEIELDTETGKFEILDYLGVPDCGVVLHPRGLEIQTKSAAVMGFGMAGYERHAYDPQNGLPAATSLWQAKIPTYLDTPTPMDHVAVGLPDPENPVGARGIGEPIQGCAGAALLCAISDALGGHQFNRVPVTADMILAAVAGLAPRRAPLRTNTT